MLYFLDDLLIAGVARPHPVAYRYTSFRYGKGNNYLGKLRMIILAMAALSQCSLICNPASLVTPLGSFSESPRVCRSLFYVSPTILDGLI